MIAVVGLVAVPGCLDVRTFEGDWSGTVVAEEAVRQGFVTGTKVDPLELSNVDLNGLTARLTTSDGRFSKTQLTRVTRFGSDELASLTFDTGPIRSYMLFAPAESMADSSWAQVIISLFSDEHVELRVIRGNDLFGVFHLQRAESTP